MSIAISFEDVSKRYRLGEIGTGTLSHDLHRAWAKLRGKPDPFAVVTEVNDRELAEPREGEANRYVWALSGISFDVQQGEILGIIGKNGAGKSTLLKLLSRVTSPTTGRIRARGRIASLLEIGTGFHPELTGRENIFLNGAILGMQKAEISQQLDEIIDFSGCAAYIDTPVKRYSSGMMVRLGFAVAAHLQCENLVVDEVLAVGDVEFQRKCLSKMQDIASTGRTVLFVSHNMSAVQSLCQRVITLTKGGIEDDGDPKDVVTRYLAHESQHANTELVDRQDRNGSGLVRLTSISVASVQSENVITSNCPLKFSVTYESSRDIENPRIMIGIYDQNGVGVYGFDSEVTGGLASTIPSVGKIECATDPTNLTAGQCLANVAIFENGNLADHVTSALEFTVEPADFFGNGRLIHRNWMLAMLGHRWSVISNDATTNP